MRRLLVVLVTFTLASSVRSEEPPVQQEPPTVPTPKAGVEPFRLPGHHGAIFSLTFSPDGKYLATAGADGDVRFWEVTTRKLLWTRFVPGGSVYAVTFSPNGKLLATAGADGVIRLWDTKSASSGRLEGHVGRATAVAFSPDGKRLASGGYDGMVRLWDLAALREVLQLRGHKDRVTSVAFASDGNWLLSGGACTKQVGAVQDLGMSDQAILWDLAQGKLSRTLEAPSRRVGFGTNGIVAVGAADPEITQLRGGAIGLRGSELFWLVDLNTDVKLLELKNRGDIFAFSPDNRFLVTAGGQDYHLPGTKLGRGGDGRPRLWEIATQKEILRLSGEDSTDVAFSPDGNLLAFGTWDGTILLWDLTVAGCGEKPLPVNMAGRQRKWEDLASGDPARAYQAACNLVAQPKEAVEFLRKQLNPVNAVASSRVDLLIAGLDHEHFDHRQAAAAGLLELGELAEPALQRAQREATSAEVRQRARELLEGLQKRKKEPEALRIQRALAVLERTGTDEARKLLRDLAEGAPEAIMTKGAREALQRIELRMRW